MGKMLASQLALSIMASIHTSLKPAKIELWTKRHPDMSDTTALDTFREETRDWLETNCPQEMRLGAVHFEDAYEIYRTDAAIE